MCTHAIVWERDEGLKFCSIGCVRGGARGAGGDEIRREGLSENWGKRKFKNEVSILVFHLGKIKEQREISSMLTLTLGTFDSLTIITLRQVSVHRP